MISSRIHWLDLLAVQGAFKRLLTPHFKTINYAALSLLHGPNLTSIHDYWKKHSFDSMGLSYFSLVKLDVLENSLKSSGWDSMLLLQGAQV